jgi:hypothetical protein
LSHLLSKSHFLLYSRLGNSKGDPFYSLIDLPAPSPPAALGVMEC